METFTTLILLFLSIFMVTKSADYAILYSSKIAEGFKFPKYIIGFIVVAVISILPETFISVSSAIDGVPAFGLGVLFGSNVADLTLVMFLIVFLSGHSLKVESRIINNELLYLGIMATPIILGLNGHYSRNEGLALIILGVLFYAYLVGKHKRAHDVARDKISAKNIVFFLLSMIVLLLGANLAVKFGVDLASILGVSPLLVGMFVVGIGTTIPELSFSLKAARKNQDGLALGDMLGTVIADATVVVGLTSLIRPFSFEPRIVYITGFFMFLAMIVLLFFMKSGRRLTKKEGVMLFIFYLLFVVTELVYGMVSRAS